MSRILVIKLGALGDFVQAFGPFAAIRAHHPNAHITLLTTPPFVALARASPWFDAVDGNGRPSWRAPSGWWRLMSRLRSEFGRVYDLQTSARSSRYRRLMGGAADWSGIAGGASHPHANPERDAMHTADRQREQLQLAGIARFPPPELDWLDDRAAELELPERFVVLVPGASPHRPGKRWPIAHYAALAAGLDVPAVVVGGHTEGPLAAAIQGAAPRSIDLTGRTGLLALAGVARRALAAIANDTGPAHLLALVGCPTIVLFGAESDPALTAPRGRAVAILQRPSLTSIEVSEVSTLVETMRALR